MSKTTYEEYLKRYGSLTYKNTGTSMLPLLKQGRDAFIVRAVGEYETCKKWDVVLYKRPPESYVLHRVVRVLGNSYDILGDNCIGIERNIPKGAVIGVMTGFIRNGKKYEADNRLYKLYVLFWCKPYRIRILMKKYCYFTAGADGSRYQQCFYALLLRGIVSCSL